jgi:KAP family P-loop domain
LIRASNNHSNSNQNSIKIITDEPTSTDSLDFRNYAKRLAEIIIESEPRFSIGIFGGWGTGKTSLMEMIRDELKSSDSGVPKILPVWFDAWKYEKEKYIAVIPMIRTIRIALENTSASGLLRTVRKGLDRAFAAFTQSTEINLGLDQVGSIQTDLSKFVNILRSDGSVRIGDDTINYYSHFTDNLSTALNKVRKQVDFRIVIFIDDLDRCMPENALEVLESIKVFFDINGIVFVIGMDPASIDKIVSVKYGERTTVTGLDYIQKIVQLPFQIPTWGDSDISKFIQDMTDSLKDTSLYDEFNRHKDLIVRAVPPNPRQVKRFLNTVILTKSVFNKDVDKLLVVQALNFRREWKNFLEFITRDDRRDEFIKQYKKLKDVATKVTLDDFTKSMLDKYPSFTDIFSSNRLVFKTDDPLTTFLDSGAIDILSAINKMEDYRRALDTTSLRKITSIKKVTQYEEPPVLSLWFTHKELLFKAGIKNTQRYLKFTDEYKIWDWNNCAISCTALTDKKKLKFIVRSSHDIFSDYRQKEVTLRYMIDFDEDISTNFEIIEDDYGEPIDNIEGSHGNPQRRWVIPLGNDHYIWQWKTEDDEIDNTEISKALTYIKSSIGQETTEDYPYLLNIGTNNLGDDNIVPVIYTPAIPHWGNFVREIHCHRESSDSDEIEVSIVFDMATKHKILDSTYKSIRSKLYGSGADVETFKIKLRRGNPEFFEFPDNYSGNKNLTDDDMHEGRSMNGMVPQRKIQYYYGNIKHPIVFINTLNHAMAERDTNHRLWKWEYIPWLEDCPVVLGQKSREEINKDI